MRQSDMNEHDHGHQSQWTADYVVRLWLSIHKISHLLRIQD